MPIVPLRAAIFDFGGVMTEPLYQDYSHVSDEMLGLVRFFLAEFQGVYHLPTGAHDLHLLETGQISYSEFFVRLCRRYAAAGNPLIAPAEAEVAVFGRDIAACGAMQDAVRQLRGSGVRTALLTNMWADGDKMLRRVAPVDELFDAIVDSSQVGLRKPDPAIYRLACRRLGVEPSECLFVDDLKCNTDAAAKLGMTVIECLDPVECADEVVRLVLGHAASDEVAGQTAVA